MKTFVANLSLGNSKSSLLEEKVREISRDRSKPVSLTLIFRLWNSLCLRTDIDETLASSGQKTFPQRS